MPEQPRPSTRRQWAKSMDVWPIAIPALQQHSPGSAVSDTSACSDDALSTPDRSDARLPHLDSALADSPEDVKATTICALQAAIRDMRAQHEAAVAERDARIQQLVDELQQCRAELQSALDGTTRTREQLAAGEAQAAALRAQLAESEAKRRTAAQEHAAEVARRESETRALRKQLAAVSLELSAAKQVQPEPMSALSGEVTSLRLPVLVGDCIRRQKRVTRVG